MWWHVAAVAVGAVGAGCGLTQLLTTETVGGIYIGAVTLTVNTAIVFVNGLLVMARLFVWPR